MEKINEKCSISTKRHHAKSAIVEVTFQDTGVMAQNDIVKVGTMFITKTKEELFIIH